MRHNKCHFVHNNQQHIKAAHQKKHRHHDPPQPPASNDFKLIGECNRPTSHGGSRSLQHGDAIFWSEINIFSVLFTIILQAADGCARFQKGDFCSELLCVLICRWVKQMRTNPNCPAIFFLPMPYQVLAWFRTRGGGSTMVTMFERGAW